MEPFDDGVVVHQFPFRGLLGYFTMVPCIRSLLKRIQPDVVNAHYASGYGTTACLADFHPWVLSVWGSDVYDFPGKSPLHRWWVRTNLLAADRVASTSYCMAEQTRRIAPALADIAITPFGVNISAYQKVAPINTSHQEGLVIGTVKIMADKYGIDTLIEAFAMLKKRLKESSSGMGGNLTLRLVGDGPQSEELKALTQCLDISDSVTFVGRVPHTQVPTELAKLDVYVALSRLDSESFGVAIIEACAASRPVVVSDAGGLPEVTVDGVTGLVVPRKNPEAAAEALEKLVNNPSLRKQMGDAGRRHVEENYSWDACISTMLQLYSETIQSHKSGF